MADGRVVRIHIELHARLIDRGDPHHAGAVARRYYGPHRGPVQGRGACAYPLRVCEHGDGAHGLPGATDVTDVTRRS